MLADAGIRFLQCHCPACFHVGNSLGDRIMDILTIEGLFHPPQHVFIEQHERLSHAIRLTANAIRVRQSGLSLFRSESNHARSLSQTGWRREYFRTELCDALAPLWHSTRTCCLPTNRHRPKLPN